MIQDRKRETTSEYPRCSKRGGRRDRDCKKKKKENRKKPRARSVTRHDQFAKVNALCYFFDSRSLDDRRACRANWQHAGTREFPDRANLCGGRSSRRRTRVRGRLFFLFLNPPTSPPPPPPSFSRNETRLKREKVTKLHSSRSWWW